MIGIGAETGQLQAALSQSITIRGVLTQDLGEIWLAQFGGRQAVRKILSRSANNSALEQDFLLLTETAPRRTVFSSAGTPEH